MRRPTRMAWQVADDYPYAESQGNHALMQC